MSCVGYYLHYFVTMRKLLLWWILLLWLIAWWCTKKIETSLVFEEYSIPLATQNNYQEITANILPGTAIIKQYMQQTDTGFVGSIIIAKTNIQSGIDIKSLATNNSKSLTRKISWAKKPSTDEFSFDCWSGKREGILQKITIEEGNEVQYMNQLFFATTNSLYGISSMTNSKKESKNLAKSMKKITCITENTK